MNEDSDILVGFNAEFERSGEAEVRRKLPSYSAGKREMAEIWLASKQQEAVRRTERRYLLNSPSGGEPGVLAEGRLT